MPGCAAAGAADSARWKPAASPERSDAISRNAPGSAGTGGASPDSASGHSAPSSIHALSRAICSRFSAPVGGICVPRWRAADPQIQAAGLAVARPDDRAERAAAHRVAPPIEAQARHLLRWPMARRRSSGAAAAARRARNPPAKVFARRSMAPDRSQSPDSRRAAKRRHAGGAAACESPSGWRHVGGVPQWPCARSVGHPDSSCQRSGAAQPDGFRREADRSGTRTSAVPFARSRRPATRRARRCWWPATR